MNIFSVDVEDYFHASALAKGVAVKGRDNLEHRIVDNTSKLMDIVDEAGVHGTFFVLGWVAENYPALVRRIADAGHEVACHGYSHTLVYEQSPGAFRDETIKAKRLLEDVCGQQVTGYRAASFSITEKSLWALDVLCEAGFEYDSSIFPTIHKDYGIPGAPLDPYTHRLAGGGRLIEIPISVTSIAGIRVPVSGGGYFRLYPYPVSKWAIGRLNRNGRVCVFYIHPWELDNEQPRLPVGAVSRFRHYNNLGESCGRLRKLLSDFEFGSIRSFLVGHHLEKSAVTCDVSHGKLLKNQR